MLILQALVLLVGSLLLSVMYENIAASGAPTSFSLPLASIVIITLGGTALSYRWGWSATAGVLLAYGAYCVVAGRLDR